MPPPVPPPVPPGSSDATSDLLARVLDADRFGDPRYLPWFYGANPRGSAIEEHVDEPDPDRPGGSRRIAHYAVLPTAYRTPTGRVPFIFSSNVATDPTVRRGGLFREMAEKVYARAAETGAPAMVGVGNDQSTVVVVERFGWTLLGPMPVRICLPTARARAVTTHVVHAGFLGSSELAELVAEVDRVPVRDWAQAWDADFVRWRLSRPGARYLVHVGADAVAVSVRARAPLGIPAAVLLKVWPRAGATLPVPAGPLVTAACRAHHAPVAVYAGHNAHVRVRGVPAPRRLQPSPLNVVCKVLDPDRVDAATFRLDTFELLDMDAY